MKKKRIISAVLVLIMIIALVVPFLAGCGTTSTGVETVTPEKPEVTSAAAADLGDNFSDTEIETASVSSGHADDDDEKSDVSEEGIEYIESDRINEINKSFENVWVDTDSCDVCLSLPEVGENDLAELYDYHGIDSELLDLFEQDLVNNTFDLYRQFKNSGDIYGNTVLSGYSVYNAFTFLLRGASDTETVKTRLNLTKFVARERNDLPNYIITSFESLDSNFNQQQSFVCNGILATDKTIRSDYKDATMMNMMNIEIVDGENAAYNQLNDYFSKLTHHTIFNDDYNIDSGYIASAGYFECEWENPSEYYYKNTFTNSNGEDEAAYFMNFNEKLQYVHIADTVSGVIKPFKNNLYSIMLLIPNDENSDYSIASALNHNMYSELLESAEEKMVDVYIPRFKASSEFSMKQYMKNKGVKGVYDENAAYYVYSPESIEINDAMFTSYLSINAVGAKSYDPTEIAHLRLDSHDGEVLKFNRPFVYIIFDNKSQLPVMVGDCNTAKIVKYE